MRSYAKSRLRFKAASRDIKISHHGENFLQIYKHSDTRYYGALLSLSSIKREYILLGSTTIWAGSPRLLRRAPPIHPSSLHATSKQIATFKTFSNRSNPTRNRSLPHNHPPKHFPDPQQPLNLLPPHPSTPSQNPSSPPPCPAARLSTLSSTATRLADNLPMSTGMGSFGIATRSGPISGSACGREAGPRGVSGNG